MVRDSERGPTAQGRARPRVPPGQSVTRRFPILHEGEPLAFDPKTWRLHVHGRVEQPQVFDWKAFNRLPQVELEADFHCVTRWSKLGVRWRGVRLRDLLARCRPAADACSVRFADHQGYDTAIPLAVALEPEVLLATELEGSPLPPEHGGPLRAVVPGLYAWKSCKWLVEIEVLAEHRLGYWETRGYHDGADPWREERYA